MGRQLIRAFPIGVQSLSRDPSGKVMAIVYDLPPAAWKSYQDDGNGLRARFYERTDAGDRLILERVDKVVEYINGNDFPKAQGSGMVWGRWSARCNITRRETYEMVCDSSNGIDVLLDGKRTRVEPGPQKVPVSLGVGKHSVELRAVCPRVWDAKLRWELRSEGPREPSKGAVVMIPEGVKR
jgi:hypothetical protein